MPQSTDVVPERTDNFTYTSAREGVTDRAEEIVHDARVVHAKSYISEGFLTDTAVDEKGEVIADIDKTRGPAVEYFVGYDNDGAAVSALRTVDAGTLGGVEQLPGYQMTTTTLSSDAKEFLRQAFAEGRPVKEISSFGHVPEVTSIAGLEMLRHVFQDARDRGEVWFFTMVAAKSRALTHAFGPYAFRHAGDSVVLTDDGINNVELVPGIVDTREFLDDIVAAVSTEQNPKYQQRYAASLKNYSEGIAPHQLSDEVNTMLDALPEESFMDYATRKGVRTAQEPWQEPFLLDYANRFDRSYAQRLVERGDVRHVLNPNWGSLRGDDDYSIGEREGNWVYYPWKQSIVHMPSESDYNELIHGRDRDMVTADEQAALKSASALFAGLSVGSHVLEHMTYAGVGGTQYLADFDTIDGSNLNRIHAGALQVGEAKVDWFAKKSSELTPYTKLHVLRDGVTEASLAEMNVPDIIFDEVDNFATKALLRCYAKEHKRPLIMASDVGYTSIIDIERYDQGAELFNGRLNQVTIERMLAGELTPKDSMDVTTKLIGLSNASFRLLRSVNNPAIEAFPQLEVSAAQGGALATVAARDILLGRPVKSGRYIHNARKDLRLPGEMSLSEGLAELQTFLKNTYATRKN